MGANTEVLRQGGFSASSCGGRVTLTEAREPTTATRSRCPLAFTLSTAQPFSSLKKVTRSISPERLSTGRADGCSVRNCGDCVCHCSGCRAEDDVASGAGRQADSLLYLVGE